MKDIYKISFITICFLICSCDTNRVFEQNIEIQGDNWNKNQLAEFFVDITDTISYFNLYINIRNGSKYPYSNLYMFISTYAPDGASIRDTVECRLADDRGKWLGSGLGSIWFNQIPYKNNIKFFITGQYKFVIEQAMRLDKLPSIKTIGLRVEKIIRDN